MKWKRMLKIVNKIKQTIHSWILVSLCEFCRFCGNSRSPYLHTNWPNAYLYTYNMRTKCRVIDGTTWSSHKLLTITTPNAYSATFVWRSLRLTQFFFVCVCTAHISTFYTGITVFYLFSFSCCCLISFILSSSQMYTDFLETHTV